MKIALGTNHAGFELKEGVKDYLRSLGHDILDCGAFEYDSNDDYPDFVLKAALSVSSGEAERAIVFGGSGQGEAIAANKVNGVRAIVYYGGDTSIVTLSREHNDANILSLAARFLSLEEVKNAVSLWLETSFSEDERHKRRIEKISQFEKERS